VKQLTLVVPLIRILIVVLFAGVLFWQVFSLPGQFSHITSEAPQLGFVPSGLLLTLFGGEVVLVVAVLRALLHQAAAISADLEEVI